MKETKILKTIHGSHLYGLDHSGSDLDMYTVYSGKGRARQTISGDLDEVEIHLDHFLYQASRGVPQALEAMFAPEEVVEIDEIPFRNFFVASGGEVTDRYIRTIYNFSLYDTKRRMHGARLALNLRDLNQYGRFNPRLGPHEIKLVQGMGLTDEDTYRRLIEEISGFEFFDYMDRRRNK